MKQGKSHAFRDPLGSEIMPKPPASEWGKLNAGQHYGVLAIDLGRAIFGVAWGKYELPLIYCLIEHSWKPAREADRVERWPDPKPCKINFNALSSAWGYPRQRLYEARDTLKAKRFMIEDQDGFWVNKDAHSWLDPATGQPLLGPKMLAYASDARKRKGKSDKQTSVTTDRDTDSGDAVELPTNDKQSSVTPECDNVSRSSVTSEDASTTVCHGPACQDVTVQRDNVSRSSVTCPIEERAAEELETKDINTTPLPPSGGGGAVEDTPKPEKTSNPKALPRKPDPTHVAALIELARFVLGDRCDSEYVPNHIEGWLFSYTLEQVRDVIYAIGAKQDQIKHGLPGYANGCFRRIGQESVARDVEEGRRMFASTTPAAIASAWEPKPMTDEDEGYTDLMYAAARRKNRK